MKCDRCGKEAEVRPFPFKYMDRSNSRADEDGYFQPFGCASCVEWEDRLGSQKRLRQYGFSFLPLRPLLPWIGFKDARETMKSLTVDSFSWYDSGRYHRKNCVCARHRRGR